MGNSPHIVAIIQARMGSTRLPGKVMAEIAGKPMLWHVVYRVRQAQQVDEVVVATTDKTVDQAIIDFATAEGILVFRGSEEDVLDRYYQAAKWIDADVVVRITADCPLIDSQIIDRVIAHYLNGNFDYVSNTHPPTYPDGMDVEVFSFNALKKAWKEAGWLSEREHVTPYIWKNPDKFKLFNVENDEDLSGLRWSVDHLEDLEFVRAVYKHLGRESFGMIEVLNLLKKYPELVNINAGIERNEGYQKSLREDRLIRVRR